MSIYSNRQMCESVCKKESACGECILQDAQNMTVVVCSTTSARDLVITRISCFFSF